ncbi:MAG: RNA polymerase sigma factor [Patescibacteria group bacterium]|nr:RNA polymerase sigma factor [Patescibacteria group bacterium]MDD5294631.1 RNA polymerase sigma factor [Patescibacteria group bacterium]MDD5554395.1 RNA polymerase sigma factor [Patescibacteria group bacterium]
MDFNKIQNSLVTKKQEKELLSGVKKRDKEAFIKAYDLYVDQIFRFVYFKVGNKEEANDLTSVVFLKTWNYIQDSSIEDFKTLRALIYKIARTSIIDHYRKNSNFSKVSFENKEGEPIDIKDEKQDIARQAEINFDFGIIEQKLKELKDEYREVIILRFIDELNIKEMAAILDKPKNNVRVLLHRALKALRELMENENGK